MTPIDPHLLDTALSRSIEEADLALKSRDYVSASKILDGLGEPRKLPEAVRGVLWSRRAKIAFETRSYQDAKGFCRRSIDLLGPTLDHQGLSYVQLVLGYTLSALGEIHEAELAVRDAISNLRRAGREEDLSEPYNALAQIFFSRSEYDRSCEYLTESRRLAEIAGRTDDARRILGNLGRVLILSGRWEEAEVALRESLAAQEELGRTIGIVRNLLSLGYLYLLQHRTHEVRPMWDRAADLIDEKDLALEHVILLEYKGDLALAEERYEDAIAIYEEALERGDRLAADSSIQNQLFRRFADACVGLKDYKAAEEWAVKAASLSAKLGDRQEEGSAYRALGLAQAGMGEEYAPSFDRALSTLRAVGDPYELAKAYLAYGLTLATGGDASASTEALRLLDRAREMASDLSSEKIEAEVALAQARARASLGQLDSALAHLGLAEEVLGERARTYRRELEQRLVTEAVSPNNEFLVFQTYVSDGDSRSASIESDLSSLARKLDADSACILLVSDDVVTCEAAFGPARFDGPALGAAFASTFKLGKAARPMLYTDLAAHDDFAEMLRGAGRNAETVVAIPLRFADDIIGVVYLERCITDRPFGRSALNMAVAFADPLSFRLAEVRARKKVSRNQASDEPSISAQFPSIITRSSKVLAMLGQVSRVMNAPITISLEGETGVGKDLLAKAIHQNSNRREKRFISVNCAALPESLLESELFGHQKGAFTGADRDKPGLLEEANGGTFFLDEIGEMPLSIQAKLLRVLEDKEVVRLGDSHPRKVDMRIIIASNRDLKAEMDKGNFRADLFYRLCTLSFCIPPLRDRREDIPLLLDYFLARYSPADEDGKSVKIDPVAFQWLVEYDWPGNVRELENEIKKMVLLAGPARVIDTELLSQKFFRPDVQGAASERPMGEKRDFSLYDLLALYEKKYIQEALVESSWVKKHAARALSIPESTLRLKMKQYGLKPVPKEKSA